ncbi:MAG: S-methyl-5-thioribose-1-phosphate isomerase, partial [Candidatus Micrarchaeota archaeon]|nr:S-methyl-5-thioribose-1-phosphate isomerase [Candidatus Micrarchaeota archaeon]
MRFRTLGWKENYLELIDQTLLPGKTLYLKCRTAEDVWKAIRTMKVRGAPAIGVAAAFGVYLGVMRSQVRDIRQFKSEFAKMAGYIASARPTARNLFSAVEVMEEVAASFKGSTVEHLKKALLKKALEFAGEDAALCRAMGRHGARLLKSGDCVLTHCNAGALATAGMGTALSVIYSARQAGKKIEMIATETRPFLQGARLTAWELKENGVPVTLICDNMVGSVMRTGRINRVIVGADRIAANGDTANKIG